MSHSAAQPHEALDGVSPDQIPPEKPALRGPITLQVGERTFYTTVETLVSESDYFKAMFAGRWPDQRQMNGSYFIDADPDLFAHILRFMRQGTLPIFFDGKNFDYGLYRALRDCAGFFQVERLEQWIEDEEYAIQFTREHSVKELSGPEMFTRSAHLFSAGRERSYYPSLRTRQVYVCPRNIPAHTTPEHCGGACWEKLGDRKLEYKEEQYWSALVIDRSLRDG